MLVDVKYHVVVGFLFCRWKIFVSSLLNIPVHIGWFLELFRWILLPMSLKNNASMFNDQRPTTNDMIGVEHWWANFTLDFIAALYSPGCQEDCVIFSTPENGVWDAKNHNQNRGRITNSKTHNLLVTKDNSSSKNSWRSVYNDKIFNDRLSTFNDKIC